MNLEEVMLDMLRQDEAMRARFLTDHAPDSAGRCPVCPAAGDSSGRMRAPCTLYSLAVRAGT